MSLKSVFSLFIIKSLNFLFSKFGYVLKKDLPLIYLHQYSSYEDYASTQVRFNRKKIDRVWADSNTLTRVADIIQVEHLGALLKSDHIIGTDISDTALQYPNLVVWDFHDINKQWIGQMDFVYTNSLDQSWKPFHAIRVWLEQLSTSGLLIIEHSRAHGVEHASSMDPFGVSPEYMPYVLCEHFGASISLQIEKSLKDNLDFEVWLFVIRKAS